MLRISLNIFLLPVAWATLSAQDGYLRNWKSDVEHYVFQLELSDDSDQIKGVAKIQVRFDSMVEQFHLDLKNTNSEGTGMKVASVQELEAGGRIKTSLAYRHENDRLSIQWPEKTATGSRKYFQIEYSGTPADGLIISKNKYGDRCFFGDNWPNRAHHWLPCVDHPSDKSTVEFIVTAPDHYQVIGNGYQAEETNLAEGKKLTHWKEQAPLATKVMVIGAARFAVQWVGWVDNIPVSSWVYPQDRDKGFYDYAPAMKPLDFMHHHVGPYSYEKLANVQSKTRWGGMENAGNIFYYENSVTGSRQEEALLAHEIAHQWFGNSAGEKSWHHVWLSEGFATYFADLYMEHTYGFDRLKQRMAQERTEVIDYTKRILAPVIDPAVRDINRVLNTNSYQKGAWVLHMLRKKLGDEVFWNGIREYYQKYQNSNALTSDFQSIMENVSNLDLNVFFQQWLYESGHPLIEASWQYKEIDKVLEIEFKQVQRTAKPFACPIEVGIAFMDEEHITVHNFPLHEWKHSYQIRLDKKPQEVLLDPNIWLLFEGDVVQRE